jgi:hypothetical protein
MIENKNKPPNRLHSAPFWLLLVLAFALISRLFIILLYQPVLFSDSPSYRRLAEAVLRGFVKYDGTRTPGYPVFLALVGSDRNVWIAQLLLGIATTLLLFYIGWKLTDKPWFGGMIGLVHTLNLGQLFYESNLLTESLTTFLLVLTMAGMLIWLLYPLKRSLWLVFFIGLISAFTLLVRPLFIYLPFLLVIFLWIGTKKGYSTTLVVDEVDDNLNHDLGIINRHPIFTIFVFILPVLLFLGGWISFIYINYGDFSLTTMSGFHLIQHTGNFFEYVPDEYAPLRDTYLQYRDAHIAKYGTQTNTIWEAIPEMSRVSGYNFYDLSRVLAQISIQLIVKHPLLFLKNAFTGWWMFWRTSFYWSIDALRFSWLGSGIKLAVQIQRIILFAINLFFIFSSLFYVLSECLAAIRHKPGLEYSAKKAYSWLLLSTIWVASILQTLLDHGDNPRFLVPLQSLVVLWVALFCYQLFITKYSSKLIPPSKIPSGSID